MAGINLGGGYATFPGVVGTAITKVCSLEVARTGLTEVEAERSALDAVAISIESTTRAGYLPDAEPMIVKLVAERGTGRLLGGQIVGGVGSAKRIDTVATALHARMRVDEVIDLDLAYAPPFSSVWDPDRRRRAPPRRSGSDLRLPDFLHGARSGREALRARHDLGGRCPVPRATATSSTGGWPTCSRRRRPRCGPGGVALVAVGGYGRAELSLQSDIDVVLLHTGRSDIGTLADKVWYPIWDEGLKLGHAVRTTREALALAADDLDTATSLLQIRHLAGDAERSPTDLAERALQQWQKRSKRWLGELARRVRERHERGRRGGLPPRARPQGGSRRPARRRTRSDWAEAARSLLWEGDDAVLERRLRRRCSSARVELHRRTGRPGDVLLPRGAGRGRRRARRGVRRRADAPSWPRPPGRSPGAATTRGSGSTLRSAARSGGARGGTRPIGDGLVLRDGEVHLTADADPAADPSLVLRAAAAAAAGDTRIHRVVARAPGGRQPARSPSPGRLRCAPPSSTCSWPGTAPSPSWRRSTSSGCGRTCCPSGRPCAASRSATPTTASPSIGTSWRPPPTPPRSSPAPTGPTCSSLGALLHDIGKGYPGDHTEVGHRAARHHRRRGMGFPADGRRRAPGHGPPPPPAARRRHAPRPRRPRHPRAGGRGRRRRRAPSSCSPPSPRPTASPPGPPPGDGGRPTSSATSSARVGHVLGGGTAERGRATTSPTAEHLDLLRAGRQVLRGDGDRLTVVAPDRPGPVQPGHRACSPCTASACSTPPSRRLDGMALEVLRVESSFGPTIAWDKVVADLERVLEGRLALQARLAERARVYGGRRSKRAGPRAAPGRGRQHGVARSPRSSRCTPRTRSACSTASRGRWRSSSSTSCPPRSRPSASGWSTPSTFAAPPGDKLERPRSAGRGRAGPPARAGELSDA